MKKILINIFMVAFFICLVVSGVQIYRILKAEKDSKESVQSLIDEAVMAVSYEEKGPEDPETPETVPITVDFDALRSHCGDIIAWLYCEDTIINYPVVQAEDNNYYLRRLTDGTHNTAGTLFVDFRNSADFSDPKTVIYGHNMKNDTMFGTLPEYVNQEYYDSHPKFYLLTPEQNFRVDLIAGYITASVSDTYEFEGFSEKRDAFLKEIRENSTFTSDTEVGENDSILLLSTCSYEYDGARYVLAGKLTVVPSASAISASQALFTP